MGNGEESDVDDDEAPGIIINGRISVSRRIVASNVATESTGRGGTGISGHDSTCRIWRNLGGRKSGFAAV